MAHKQRTPFTLKSGNATAFKNMGSYSPMMQAGATTTDAPKTGLGKLLDDVKSLVQNVGGKLKEGKKAADVRKQEQKKKDEARTGLDRMKRQGKSQYQLDQMDAADARKQAAQTVPVEVNPPPVERAAIVTPVSAVTEVGTGAGAKVGTGATEAATNINIEETAKKVIKGEYGDGKKREIALGSDYKAVQALVNEILRRKK